MESRGRRNTTRIKVNERMISKHDDTSSESVWSMEDFSSESSESGDDISTSKKTRSVELGDSSSIAQSTNGTENAYFHDLTLNLNDSDDSIDEEDLEDLMFGLTTSEQSARRRKRRKRRKPLFSVPSTPRQHRKSAAQSTKTLSAKATSLLQEANNAFVEGEFKVALEKCIEVVKESPGAHDPFHLMGLIYETAYQDYRRAINAYLVAASILKSDIDLWKRIGQMAEKFEADSLAIYCYRRVLPPSRHKGHIDEEVAFDCAKLFIRRYEYSRAAVYLHKLFVRHSGNSFLAVEHAKCFLKISNVRGAAIILETCLAYSLPQPVRDFLPLLIKNHEWLQDAHILNENESLNILLAHADAGETEDPSLQIGEPEILEPINWQLCEMLLGILIELGECQRAACIGGKILVQANINTKQKNPVAVWTDANEYHNAIVDQFDQTPLSLLVKITSAAIRSDVANAEWMSDMILKQLETSNDETKSSYYSQLADSYFVASDPLKALSIYNAIPQLSSTQNGEFWLKAAKCYIKLKQYDRAAEFLELLSPNTAATRLNPTDTMQDIVSRVRAVEARLLLWQIFNGEHVIENKETEAANEITSDHRIRHLIVGSSLYEVPKVGINEQTRKLIILRVAVHGELLERAKNELSCCTNVREWIVRNHCDALPSPEIPQQSVKLYLHRQLSPLLAQPFSICEIWDALAGVDMSVNLPFLGAQPERLSQHTLCQHCRESQCSTKLARFLSTWRLLICAEYIVLLRDAAIDMRRVLQESSRHRAEALTKHLRITQNISVDTPLEESIQHSTPEVPTPDDIESGLIIKTKSKGFSDITRRRQNQYERGVPSSQLILHRTLREKLNVVSLEDILGWLDYSRLLEAGTALLVKENLPALAVELLECTLLSIRYSRTLKNHEYAAERNAFKVRTRRLVIRTAMICDLIRVTLYNIRSRIIVPSLKLDPSKTRDLFNNALLLYASVIFSGTFSHACLTSIAASTARDILSFNRAWVARRLLEKPTHFLLILITGHYCILSTRFAYAVAEYTRALSIKPDSCVASLCLAVSTISLSTSRGVQDRHHVVLRSFSALRRALTVRTAWGAALAIRVQDFVKKKVSRIITAAGSNELFWQRIRAIVDAQDPKLTKDVLVELLSLRIADWVETYVDNLETYTKCENLYNQARAYHHLNLTHLAAPLYDEVLSKLSQMKVGPGLSEVADTILGCSRGNFSLVTLLKLSQSGFPPAMKYCLCDGHSTVNCRRQWYCKHAENRTGRIQWPHNRNDLEGLVMCQIAEDPEEQCESLLSFEQFDGDRLVLDTASCIFLRGFTSAVQEVPAITETENLQGLFTAKDQLDHPRLRPVCNALLNKYLRDLPPGLFHLTTDRRQLIQCSALNASQITRTDSHFTFARYVQRNFIVWAS